MCFEVAFLCEAPFTACVWAWKSWQGSGVDGVNVCGQVRFLFKAFVTLWARKGGVGGLHVGEQAAFLCEGFATALVCAGECRVVPFNV